MSPAHGADDSATAGTTRPAADSLGPAVPAAREPVLDVLRGVALLGILLINFEYMRGSDFYAASTGDLPVIAPVDRGVQFLLGWLAAGKFQSSLALLFGVGAGSWAARALRAPAASSAGAATAC